MELKMDKKKIIEALDKTKKALELLAKSKIEEAAKQIDELKKRVEDDSNK
jgi:hypothetical protein